MDGIERQQPRRGLPVTNCTGVERSWNILPHPDQAVVTGAFSFTGMYVAKDLLARGVGVTTLTRNPGRENPFAGQVAAAPLELL